MAAARPSQAGSPAGLAEQIRRYAAAVRAWLEERKRYPRRARMRGQEGVVVLRVTVEPSGAVSAFGIEQGSGHRLLDAAAEKLVEGASPLPAPPAALARTGLVLKVPVSYVLR